MRMLHVPHMSLGAWIFATGVAVAIIAPAGVYATANTIMAIGNPNGTTTAYVTPTRQLQTTITAPANVVHASGHIGHSCASVYTPPAGKAIVVTQITYDVGTGTAGNEFYAELDDANCSGVYDFADTTQPYETEARTYPSGLPMPSVGADGQYSGGTGGNVVVTGYLIPAAQLPPEMPQPRRPVKRMSGSE